MMRQTRVPLAFLVAAALLFLTISTPLATGQPAPCFPTLPTPGWTPFDVGAVAFGASRQLPGTLNAYELCSQSSGYGVESDSFRFLFRLLRAHWVISARLDRLEPGGCAGLDARVHLGSSHLTDHPYVAIYVRRLVTGGLALHSSLRTEVGVKATDGGAAPVAVKLPIYLRIERDGDKITTFFSPDGRGYTGHLRADATGTGLAALLFRAGMKQASGGDSPSTALFSEASSQVLEDRRPPGISRVEPNVGPVTGGTMLMISGQRLEGTTGVLIGGLSAEVLKVEDTSVVVRTPKAEGPRSADVVVRTKTGVGALSSAFTQIGEPFIRADCNGDGKLDISDAVAKLGFLFLGSAPCQCLDALDANADGRPDLSDAVYTLGHLFLGTAPPPAPFPAPGLPPGPSIPCRLPAQPQVTELRLPPGQRALREGDLFTLIGRGFPDDPARVQIFLGSTPAEVLDISRTEVRARVGMVAQDLTAVSVGVLVDIGVIVTRGCKPTRCLFPVFIGNISANLSVGLIRSQRVMPIGSSKLDGNVALIPFDVSNLEPESIIGVMGSIILPPVGGEGGLSRGSQVLNLQLRPGGKMSPTQVGEEVASAMVTQLTGGGEPREVDVAFDPQRRAMVLSLDSKLVGFLKEQGLSPSIDISIYGLGRPPPCTCTADLDLDGVDESYTPLVDDRGYAWCRLYELWKHCGGLPVWEYFIPRNCVYIESGTMCESDGSNTYPIFPLPHPHTIAPGVKSAMVNKSAYCHIRQHALWNLCKLRDLELMGDLLVPHFPRDAVVIKTDWSTAPPGTDSLYYSYPYDNGTTTTTEYLTAWHFTDKCIDNWVWCDLYMDASAGGNGGCGGTNSDRPAALNGLGLDNYYMCVNVRLTDSDTSCGNNFFPECNVSNCMSCHSKTGDGGFSGADNAWSNSIGGGALGSDFLYSLTSGPAVPTGGLSDGNPSDCNN
ncbi:MAG: IPT/TIG domain-containing protein [Planctomycetes bacterium]|nr:IPT/TIG domain-containing protein [Planctomycetota bacterium]